MTDTPTTALTNTDLSPSPTAIVTGASPSTSDPAVRLYAITTGGTGGVEVINIPNPTLPLNGFANGALLGQRTAFFIETQTDPADVVNIAVDGTIYVYGASAFRPGNVQVDGPVVLNYVGGMAAFVWCGDEWCFDDSLTDHLDNTHYVSRNYTLNIPNAPTGDAGSIALQSGQAEGTGAGGNITLQVGTGTTFGNILVPSIANADPHVVDALWVDPAADHVLKVSQG